MARKKRLSPATVAAIAVVLILILSIPAARLIGSTKKNTDSIEGGHYTDLEMVTIPDGTPSQIKEYEGFILSFNPENRTPNWVSWELLGSETSGLESRSNKFWCDPDIKNCPSTSDYTRSGYDRGHICPAADQKWSARAMSDCFSLANICPQNHSLNSGAWNSLEQKARIWAERDSAIVIVSGPIYLPSDKERIGQAGVRVPSAFFKVFLAPYLASPRGIGFIYPNMSSPGNMSLYATPIDEVEKQTGFDFFAALPDSLESIVESQCNFKAWNGSN